ncbi:ankyrin [Trametopsis cervina]|nr:ankyrin [Trametopsis cervina]
MSQTPEVNAFLARIEQLPAGPGVDLDTALRPSLDDEAELRRLFAQDKGNERLKNPHVGLVDLFDAPLAVRTTRARLVADEEDLTAKYIMPLSEDQRRKDGTPSMVQSLEEFKKNWAIFTEGSLSQLIDWNNVVAAGGAVQACLNPVPEKAKTSKRALRKHFHSYAYPASDVDLFLYGLSPAEAEVKINAIYEAVRDSVPWDVTCIRTKHTVSIHSQYPYRSVQIVLRLYQSPAEVLAGFDVDAPCCAYDGQRVWANPRAIVAMMRQCNTTDVTRRSPSYEVRLAKYAARDFEIYVPQLKRADVDPTIFERSIVRVQGLARLLVLEKLATADSRERYISSRRELRGRPYKANSWRRFKKKEYKGDLKDDVNAGLELSDYDVVSLHIPYGPGWDARRIEKLDLGMNSPYNPKNKGRRLHRHPAFFGTMPECLEDCCEPKNDEERELQVTEDESYIRGRVLFIIEDPGRQSMSGSFNPIDDGEWAEQAYVGPVEKLFSAIASHDRTAVANMIAQGMDVNRRDHVGRTPLQVAVLCKAADIAFDLVDANARMTARLVDGRTVLHLAAQLNMPSVVKKLLERSAVNAEAAKAAEEEAAQLKDTKSIDIEDQSDRDSDSEMHDSSEDDWESNDGDEDHSAKGEDDKAKEGDGNIPEDESEEPDVFEIDVQDWDYALSPLHYAITSGSIATLDLLIASGANTKLVAKIPSPYGNTYGHSLMLTAVTEDEDTACLIAEKLLATGVVTSEADENLATVLHRMICVPKPKLVSTFLRCDPNAKAVIHVPHMQAYNPVIFPVVSAVNIGSYSTLATLLAYGTNLSITDDDLERARELKLKNEQHVQAVSTMRVPTPIEAAIVTYRESIHLLVALGADVNERLADSRRVDATTRLTYLDYIRMLLQKLRASQPTTSPQAAENLNPTPAPVDGGHHLGLFGSASLPQLVPSAVSTVAQGPRLFSVPSTVSTVAQGPRLFSGLLPGGTRTMELPVWRKKVLEVISECDSVHQTAQSEQEFPLDGIKAYFSEVENLLVAHSAKTATELFSSEGKDNADTSGRHIYVPDIPSQSQNATGSGFAGREKTFYRHGATYGHQAVPKTTIPLYEELFAACYEGDNAKIKQLCMPQHSQKTPDTPIQISSHWGIPYQGFTPLYLAILARKWDTVKLILAIATAQYSPGDPVEKKFETKILSLDDDPDDESDDDDDDSDEDDMDIDGEPVNFIDIAKRHSDIRVPVHPSLMLHHVNAPLLWKDKEEVLLLTPFGKAIVEDDFEAFMQLLNTASSLPEDVLGGAILLQLIRYDRPAMLDEYIRRTGEGIQITKPIDVIGAEDVQEPSRKTYLGLNVHGKKRKDLASQGDPNAPRKYVGRVIPLVWNAAMSSSAATVRYLASDQPLAAYRFYASAHGDNKAKLLRKISDLGAALPAMLGWGPNGVNETVLTAAILSKRADIVEMLFTLRATEMEGYLHIRQLKHGFNNILAAVRWGSTHALFDLLLAKGVSPMETDNDGRNIYHILCASVGDEHFELLEYVLAQLPRDVTKTLLRQQMKHSRAIPLHIAAKRENLRAVRALTRIEVAQYLIRDASGSTPLHIAVTSNNPKITRIIAEAGPVEALTLENSVGTTPLETAAHSAFTSKLDEACAPNIKDAVRIAYNLSPNWNSRPFNAVEQKKELLSLKDTLLSLEAEGRLSRGTKLSKELAAFVQYLEKKVAANEAEQSEEGSDNDTRDASATLLVLKEALEARPASRGLVHLSDVLMSVNKGLEGYGGDRPQYRYDEENDEPVEDEAHPVITMDYPNGILSQV